jgi:hypothetical protein
VAATPLPACLLVVAAVVASRGCGLLMALLVPLLALIGVMDGALPRMLLRFHGWGFDMWAFPPQRGLGGEVSRWWWSHPCRGWHLVKPLLTGVDPIQARSEVRAVLVSALR